MSNVLLPMPGNIQFLNSDKSDKMRGDICIEVLNEPINMAAILGVEIAHKFDDFFRSVSLFNKHLFLSDQLQQVYNEYEAARDAHASKSLLKSLLLKRCAIEKSIRDFPLIVIAELQLSIQAIQDLVICYFEELVLSDIMCWYYLLFYQYNYQLN